MAAPSLEPLAAEFSDQGISSIFVYTREAHPSDEYPGHETLDQKVRHAQDMAAKWNIRRPMLADDLEGTTHLAFGALPNMSYVLNASGRVLYRADWTDARSIRLALEQIVFEREQRRAGVRTTPYYVEWMPQRVNDRETFLSGLDDIGDRAIDEFITAVGHAEGEKAAQQLKEWRAKIREAKLETPAD